uniref:Rho-GAP domain-containing protein n=1 Tax=Eptatretus burgeri TaxID=7764 RepID=A0A8C4QFZ6_EPTBU
ISLKPATRAKKNVIVQVLECRGLKVKTSRTYLLLRLAVVRFTVPVPCLAETPSASKPFKSCTVFKHSCQYLMCHINTEGLFRKPGSFTRMKVLKQGRMSPSVCLSPNSSLSFGGAVASDVACLLKRFFRDLPEPLLPQELHSALCQAQPVAARLVKNDTALVPSCHLVIITAKFGEFLSNHLEGVSVTDGANYSISLFLDPRGGSLSLTHVVVLVDFFVSQPTVFIETS